MVGYTAEQLKELERINETRQRDAQMCQAMTQELLAVLTANIHATSIGKGISAWELANDIMERTYRYLLAIQNAGQQN